MTGWSAGEPVTFQELFDFYHNYVKLLYSDVQTQNALPVELLFELNAALDHVARHWTYKEEEKQAVAKAYSHLKRCCLDVFKMKVQEARNQYDNLNKIDTSVVDNGDFDRDLHKLFNQIREGASEARRLEGKTKDDDAVPSFERWEAVYINCVILEKNFFLHERLSWARKRGFLVFVRQNVLGFVLGVIASLVAWGITEIWRAS